MSFLPISEVNILVATIVAALGFSGSSFAKPSRKWTTIPARTEETPIIGSMLEMPHSRLWETVREWGNKIWCGKTGIMTISNFELLVR